MARLKTLSKNESAFLDTIAYSEGTYSIGDSGYNCLVGGSLFSSYATHPRIVVKTRWGLSDAAGAYQIMAEIPYQIKTNTFDWVSKACRVSDFSPESQDKMCLYLIQHRGALDDVNAGRFEQAILKCNKEWASLPLSPYNQHTNSMASLKAFYALQGGTVS